jgi:hypothetical protein
MRVWRMRTGISGGVERIGRAAERRQVGAQRYTEWTGHRHGRKGNEASSRCGGHCLAGRHDCACRRVHRVGRRVDLRAGLSTDLRARLRACRRIHLCVSGADTLTQRVTARMSIRFIALSYLAEATMRPLLQTQAKRHPSIRKDRVSRHQSEASPGRRPSHPAWLILARTSDTIWFTVRAQTQIGSVCLEFFGQAKRQVSRA